MNKKFSQSTRRQFLKNSMGFTALSVIPGSLLTDRGKNIDENIGFDERAGKPSEVWAFREGFSSRQGENNWYYKEWTGSEYRNMRWDDEDEIWQGGQELCRISKDWSHPDKNDSVIAWKAPRTGSASIKGNVRRVMRYGNPQIKRIEFRGDGVRFKIKKEDQQIWPSEGWQELEVAPYIGGYEYPQKTYTYGGCSIKHTVIIEVKEGEMIYFHLNSRNNPDYDQVEWFPEITYDDSLWYTTDKMEIVMRPDDLKRIGMHTFDGSFGTIPDDKGGAYWWHSEWNGTLHFKLHGPLDNPSKELVFMKNEKDFWEDFDLPKGHAWIQNFYHDKETDNILAFIHYEHVEPDNYKIGLAVSKNKGDTFKLLGVILESENDLPLPEANMLGCPYIIKDGFFYLYYGDFGDSGGERHVRPSVARAQVSKVLEAADQYKLSPWNKYYKGNWDEPGMRGKATALFDRELFLHGDAAYNTDTDTYILSGYGQGGTAHGGVFFSRSKDGINWEHTWLVDNRGLGVLCPYITIVNIDGRDNAEVGREFYVYWSFNGEWGPDNHTPFVNYGLQTLYRQKIILVDKL